MIQNHLVILLCFLWLTQAKTTSTSLSALHEGSSFSFNDAQQISFNTTYVYEGRDDVRLESDGSGAHCTLTVSTNPSLNDISMRCILGEAVDAQVDPVLCKQMLAIHGLPPLTMEPLGQLPTGERVVGAVRDDVGVTFATLDRMVTMQDTSMFVSDAFNEQTVGEDSFWKQSCQTTDENTSDNESCIRTVTITMRSRKRNLVFKTFTVLETIARTREHNSDNNNDELSLFTLKDGAWQREDYNAPLQVQISTRVAQTGMHAMLEYDITLPAILPPLLESGCECSLDMLQPIPRGVITDEYQLRAEERPMTVHSVVDLEAAAYSSEARDHFVTIKVAIECFRELEPPDVPVVVTLPVHARYHRPTEHQYTAVFIPAPFNMSFSRICSSVKNDTLPVELTVTTPRAKLIVPVGDPQAFYSLNVMTPIAVWLGVMLLATFAEGNRSKVVSSDKKMS